MKIIERSHSCEIQVNGIIAVAPFIGEKVGKLAKFLESQTEESLREHKNWLRLVTSHVSVWFVRGTYAAPLFDFDSNRTLV